MTISDPLTCQRLEKLCHVGCRSHAMSQELDHARGEDTSGVQPGRHGEP